MKIDIKTKALSEIDQINKLDLVLKQFSLENNYIYKIFINDVAYQE